MSYLLISNRKGIPYPMDAAENRGMSVSGFLHKLLDPKHRWPIVVSAVCMVVVIAVVDWWVQPYISIGFLYLIPVLLVSASLPRPQIIVTALICAVLQE